MPVNIVQNYGKCTKLLYKKASFAHSIRKTRNYIQLRLEPQGQALQEYAGLTQTLPYDVDFVPIHMHCSNPNCSLYLSYIEEDRADVLDGLCLKCFRELPELDTTHKPLREVYEPNKIKPVLNIWSGKMVTWDPFEQTYCRKTKEVN